MDNGMKYEYVMELPEIREFCRFACLEQFKFRKGRWIGLLCILLAEAFWIPEAALIAAIILIAALFAAGVYYYRSTVKLLAGQMWTVFQMEGDRLRVARGNVSEVPYRNIQLIRRTKRLLLLGCMQTVKRPAWFVMPLRVFASEAETQAFVDRIRGAQGRPDFTAPPGQETFPNQAEQKTDGGSVREYMRFSFWVDGERWVRLQKGAADIVNGGTLGRAARTYGMMICGAVTVVGLSVCTCLTAGEFRWSLICYSLSLSVWIALRLFGRDPQKRIRKQLEAAKVCGPWQVSLTEEGVTVCMPMDMKNYFRWDSLKWLVETQEAFYLFYRDKKHFIMIAKESFVSWEQVDAFHRICGERGIQKTAPKKARYVPEWLTWVIFGLIVLVSVCTLAARIYLDFAGGASGARMPYEEGYAGAADYHTTRVPLEEQAETLASLGLSVPEETVESVRSAMEEYDLYDMVEESPYTWLLMDMGGPSYDEDWNLTGYSSEVFWFDFEGYDLSSDYIDILNGMLALAQGSPLDSVSDVREDMEDVDWEKGRGTVVVSLNWEGRTYRYDMEVYNDWIDVKVLSVFNELLEEQDYQKRFYATGDNGQGAIVFFCTEEWAAEFTEKTGLILEAAQE